ncbi:MAG: hypothetical protein V3S29_12095 [bacterium]
MTTINQRFRLEFDFPVRFTQGLFAEENPVFLETVARLEKERRPRVLAVPGLVHDAGPLADGRRPLHPASAPPAR